jgi:hypothetical protein
VTWSRFGDEVTREQRAAGSRSSIVTKSLNDGTPPPIFEDAQTTASKEVQDVHEHDVE